MIYLKKFNEVIFNKDKTVSNRWLRKCIDGKYTVNGGVIDVDGHVDFYKMGLTEIPVKFGRVSGDFHVGQNLLTSLHNCPTYVGGGFDCAQNRLTNLVGSPLTIDGEFYGMANNLTSLEGCPKYVGEHVDLSHNKLYDLYNLCEIGNHYKDEEDKLDIYKNPVHEIFKLCPTIEFIKYLNEFRPIRGKDILGKRLEECLYMCDKEVDVSKLVFKNYTLLE